MLIYNIRSKEQIAPENFIKPSGDTLFITCSSDEISNLQNIFNFDISTLIDCMNFDENVRLNSYGSYDFLSMIYFSLIKNEIRLSEINLYISSDYIVLVQHSGDALSNEPIEKIIKRVKTMKYDINAINKIYYTILDVLLTNMSETMEKVEDCIYEIEGKLTDGKLDRSYLNNVKNMRENAYKIRKHMRPLLYIGDQLIVNDNMLILKENMRYFRNIDVRINKLFDFSVSLQEFANQLLYTYESRLTMQTNEVINKLTVITLFFGPLTVITGIYGMNFTNMPELEWYFGYPVALGIMFIISLMIFIVLKFKKWL